MLIPENALMHIIRQSSEIRMLRRRSQAEVQRFGCRRQPLQLVLLQQLQDDAI